MPDEAAEMMEGSPTRGEEEKRSGALKVLLVDDEEDYVRTMAERMEMREVGSDVALSGEDALSQLEADLPDVMVLDLKMPGMGGMEVLEYVRRRYPQVQVIILTGHGSDAEETAKQEIAFFFSELEIVG